MVLRFLKITGAVDEYLWQIEFDRKIDIVVLPNVYIIASRFCLLLAFSKSPRQNHYNIILFIIKVTCLPLNVILLFNVTKSARLELFIRSTMPSFLSVTMENRVERQISPHNTSAACTRIHPRALWHNALQDTTQHYAVQATLAQVATVWWPRSRDHIHYKTIQPSVVAAANSDSPAPQGGAELRSACLYARKPGYSHIPG